LISGETFYFAAINNKITSPEITLGNVVPHFCPDQRNCYKMISPENSANGVPKCGQGGEK